MKNSKANIIALFGIALIFSHTIIAQTYSSVGEIQVGTDNVILQGDEITPFTLASLGINTTTNPRSATLEGNSVFVRQVGDYNQTDISTTTNSSEINLLQNGNSNFTKLDYTANTAIADLIQNGNNNVINDFALNPTADISLDLIQDGNNLSFIRDGVNDLTKSIKFRQSEASPTLIVRSFF